MLDAFLALLNEEFVCGFNLKRFETTFRKSKTENENVKLNIRLRDRKA